MFDYETIRLIWWLLIGLFLIGFALTGGFDLGICSLLPLLGRSDLQRRLIINTIGPTWEGNQVWLIAFGAALFAVWPLLYAALFSGLHLALFLLLFALFFRPVGFDFRGKLEAAWWRNFWDWGLFIGGVVPALLLGVVAGNLLLGLPFKFDADLRSYYSGTLLALLNPFALLCGVISVLTVMLHGAIYLQWRTEGLIYSRARNASDLVGKLLVLAMGIAFLWFVFGVDGYRIVDMADFSAPSNPLRKTVEIVGSGWAMNLVSRPWFLIVPLVAFSALWFARHLAAQHLPGVGFASSAVGIAFLLFSLGLALFPFILPSSTDPNSSLTLWDASASHFTLQLTFWVTIIFMPIVIAYTRWVYKVIWVRPLNEAAIEENQHSLY